MKMCSCSGFTLPQRGQWNQCGNDKMVSKSGLVFFTCNDSGVISSFLKLKHLSKENKYDEYVKIKDVNVKK